MVVLVISSHRTVVRSWLDVARGPRVVFWSDLRNLCGPKTPESDDDEYRLGPSHESQPGGGRGLDACCSRVWPRAKPKGHQRERDAIRLCSN
jgi:hypothetical protein